MSVTDLEKLIAAVEAGDGFGIIPLGQKAIGEFDPNYGVGEVVCAAFSGSLDAAKRLHDALLPGWIYNLAPSFCHVFPATDNGDQDASTGQSDQPAHAWLLAILRALQAKGDSP